MRLNILRLVIALIALFAISIVAIAATPVTPPVTHTTTEVDWTAATQNTDGTQLTNLAGYHIWHGVFSKTYEVMPATVGPTTLKYVFPKLEDGDHFFAISAFNSESPPKEGPKSAEFQVTVKTAIVCISTETRPQLCAPPLTGSWTQTQTYSAPPACTPSGWLPAQPPAGACASPAPLVTVGPYSYEFLNTATPSMAAIGLAAAGLPCGAAVKVIGTTKFCQITRAQTDLIGWPQDKTLATGVWAKAK